jgi:hypothetical protein
MTTYSLPLTKTAVSRSNVLRAAAILSSAIVALGYGGSASADSRPVTDRTLLAQASGEDTLARCQQLYGLWSRHNSDGYARPLDARMGLEQCQKGNVTGGVATLKGALERAQIPIPPVDTGVAQNPTTPPATLRPRGEKRRLAQ